MIIYIFNSHFPDNSGFAIRCKREINALSRNENVVILCQGGNGSQVRYKTDYREVPLYFFKTTHNLVEKPSTYFQGIYEISRNFKLAIHFSWALLLLLLKVKRDTKLYVVCSPLSIPFITWLLSLIIPCKREVVEFHDLEPELALHIKGISTSSLIYKIEVWLEKFVSNKFNKVVVTSEGQKKVLQRRTEISPKKIFVIPNVVEEKKITRHQEHYQFSSQDFILGYFGSFSFDYTVSGLVELIDKFNLLKDKIPRIKLLLVGDGHGMKEIKQRTKGNSDIIFTGKVSDTSFLLSQIDAGIIPWKKDSMTETILPTKLFEYMAAKKAIIAPAFGEFNRILTHGKNALLYTSIDEFIEVSSSLTKNKKFAEELGAAGYKLYKEKFHPKLFNLELERIIEQ